ncbi:unnamed protein product [Fusarium fujikuroi]|nr:unnamed protein product [Fusarium fujikuroi]
MGSQHVVVCAAYVDSLMTGFGLSCMREGLFEAQEFQLSIMSIERKKVIIPQSRSTVRNLNTGQAANQQPEPEEEITQGEETTTQDEEDTSKRRPKKPKDK